MEYLYQRKRMEPGFSRLEVFKTFVYTFIRLRTVPQERHESRAEGVCVHEHFY